MSVKIRLKRMGAKRNPFYRFVVTDSRMPRDGRFVEEIGYYRPTGEEEKINVNDEKAIEWLNKGAKPSETVRNLFKKAGIRKS